MIKRDFIKVAINGRIEQLHYQYDDEAAVYIFDDDIHIGDWSINKTIKLGGPKVSPYKYDFKNYLEFIITDKNGISRLKSWYYNYDSELNVYGCDGGANYALSYFFNEFQAFKCAEWEDYNALVKLNNIRVILERTDIGNTEKCNKIKELVDSV